jgi:hypothetical protein
VTAFAATALILQAPRVASSKQGAFEMDAEYYLKNLVQFGTNSESNGERSRAIFPSPRNLDINFTTKIIRIVSKSISIISGISTESIDQSVVSKLPTYLPYFRKFAPVVVEDLSDQYYFDIVVYLYFLTAENYLKSSLERVKLRELISDSILALFVESLPKTFEGVHGDPISAARLLPKVSEGIKYLLDKFKSYGLIESYIYDDENLQDIIYSSESFKEVF